MCEESHCRSCNFVGRFACAVGGVVSAGGRHCYSGGVKHVVDGLKNVAPLRNQGVRPTTLSRFCNSSEKIPNKNNVLDRITAGEINARTVGGKRKIKDDAAREICQLSRRFAVDRLDPKIRAFLITSYINKTRAVRQPANAGIDRGVWRRLKRPNARSINGGHQHELFVVIRDTDQIFAIG